jgi:hypothetical protein
LVAERVQDHTAEEYEEAENQRERIMKELMEVRQVLEWIQETQTQDKGKGPMQRSTEEEDKTMCTTMKKQYKS